MLGNAPELIVAKVTKAKFFKTATKKLVASWRTASIHVLARKGEGNSKFAVLLKEN